jgi:rubredoxin
MDLDRYQCTVCGYIYDPKKGDPENNVKPKTPFEELPESWVCPVCGAPKSEFERL